ncbi:hypothetical protein GQ44DRAFT_64496 [Phaeosphaeriaceae sp. PMI808]|nr:hypothetical protein GQ44DRAFT_64496 [Phaeosphaeriaceae sp. PMI808]
MIVDIDQNIGSLIGLASKLVLKQGQSQRMILVPVPQKFGRTSIMYAKTSNAHHVTVNVNKEEATKVYAYTIDEVLGRIVDSGDLQSKLLIAYLHAITSTCLPDPLTRMTGTEASLQILQSAAVRSFDLLTPQNVDLLGQIASLSTKRVFYPSHEKVMQKVTWDSALPSLSQHAYFRRYVSDIFDHATKMQLFSPGNGVFRLIANTRRQLDTNHHLDERDQVRTSMFRVPGFGAEPPTTPQVEMYDVRDRHEKSKKGQRAFVAATLTQHDRAALSRSIPNLKDLLLHTHFSRATISSLDRSFDSSSLCYDSKWLGDADSDVRCLKQENRRGRQDVKEYKADVNSVCSL